MNAHFSQVCSRTRLPGMLLEAEAHTSLQYDGFFFFIISFYETKQNSKFLHLKAFV